ncbi:MAG: beta-propeller domain-containing protein [Propionibacteriaceae bacterium]|nr:beta-propeller domain-containing protein [Propionibacteriaceae bacterium]
MSDDIFAEMADQLRPDDRTREDLLRTVAAEEAGWPGPDADTRIEPTAVRTGRWRGWGWAAAAAAVALVAGFALVPRLFGTAGTMEFADPPQSGPARPAGGSEAGGSEIADDEPDVPEPAAAPAGDYATLYAAVRKAADRWYGIGYGGGREVWLTDANQAAGSAPVPAPMAAADSAMETSGSYQTNTQVAGIDEGDLVKSDGKTLFVASGTDVALVAPQGAGTRVLARIDTTAGEAGPDRSGDTYVVQGSVVDLMLHGSTLVVLVTEYAPRLDQLPNSTTTAYIPYDALQTKALLYDVSEPAHPAFLTSLGQSGAYLTSRLVDNLLYLVTEHVIPDSSGIEADDPATFVPLVSQGRQSVALDAADCVILPNPQGPRFAVASSIDLAKRARIDTESVLGGSETVYLNADNLYLGASDYDKALSKQARKAAGVSDLREVWGTRLTRIALKNGELTVAGQGVIPGNLINQFALDEYDGHLRVAVTVSGETTKRGWLSQPALYVLDSDLKIVGSLPKLAKNESVQSVRFEGPIGYVVSFERIDPLFALDLRQPKDPKVMSALKIPGFSTYLHPWSDGRLLGLGMDADANGMTTGMKLSMFDTSDPFDVTEQVSLKVPFDQSEALHNQ